MKLYTTVLALAVLLPFAAFAAESGKGEVQVHSVMDGDVLLTQTDLTGNAARVEYDSLPKAISVLGAVGPGVDNVHSNGKIGCFKQVDRPTGQRIDGIPIFQSLPLSDDGKPGTRTTYSCRFVMNSKGEFLDPMTNIPPIDVPGNPAVTDNTDPKALQPVVMMPDNAPSGGAGTQMH